MYHRSGRAVVRSVHDTTCGESGAGNQSDTGICASIAQSCTRHDTPVWYTLVLSLIPLTQVFCEEAFPILDANAEREGGGGAGGGVFVWELTEAGEAAGGAVQIYVYAGDDEVGVWGWRSQTHALGVLASALTAGAG